ncbi:MAG: hypothetical protein ABIV06_14925, partial [Thermoanaerobaculia bacterium]
AGRVVARTRDALYELDAKAPGARFRPIALAPAAHPAPSGVRSMALADGDLWLLRDDGLAKMVSGKPQAASLPYPPASGSELFSVAGELHYSGREGLFRRDSRTGAWIPVRSGPVRTLATGSARFPYIVEAHGALALLALPSSAEPGEAVWLAIDLPYPAGETLSALVSGDRLLLGSSGFGVWQARLPEPPPASPAPLSPTTGAIQRSSESEARIRR